MSPERICITSGIYIKIPHEYSLVLNKAISFTPGFILGVSGKSLYYSENLHQDSARAFSCTKYSNFLYYRFHFGGLRKQIVLQRESASRFRTSILLYKYSNFLYYRLNFGCLRKESALQQESASRFRTSIIPL